MVRNYKRKTQDRWTKNDLLEAILCIKDSKMKVNEAAMKFGMSRATLYRQYQKFIMRGAIRDVNQFINCGGAPILSRMEEKVFVKTVLDLRSQGFTVTGNDIKRICFEYCSTNGIRNQFNPLKRLASDDWYYGFLKRNPGLRLASTNGEGGKNRKAASQSPSSDASESSSMDCLP